MMPRQTGADTMFAIDTSRAPIAHVRGWATYDVEFKLTGRRDTRSLTFFAGSDNAAVEYVDRKLEEMEAELSTSKIQTMAYDIVRTRRA
jgi:hypothetical protein